MPSTLRVRSLTSLLLTIPILYLPLLASSRPIISSKPAADHGNHAPSPSNMDTLGKASVPQSLTRALR